MFSILVTSCLTNQSGRDGRWAVSLDGEGNYYVDAVRPRPRPACGEADDARCFPAKTSRRAAGSPHRTRLKHHQRILRLLKGRSSDTVDYPEFSPVATWGSNFARAAEKRRSPCEGPEGTVGTEPFFQLSRHFEL